MLLLTKVSFQRLARVPVGLCVPRARIPQYFLRVLPSRVPVQIFFAFPLALAFLFHVPMFLQLLVQWVGGEVWLVRNAATWGCYHGEGGRGTTRLSLTTNGGQTCVTECTIMRAGGMEPYTIYISRHLFTGTQI